ncbi:hypothetical protein B9Q01_05375 [Candidatus Marsarchaeota G1 archaeon OSP_D]|uniref:Uncharacterized protein n=2 Tax=Candidatus Marsarchaeota group 1 TaxID=2203770 RepID=A0A2R6AA96_9ARCH|nr:MAG: hypothetical protein B9Q01_05375 [Candidatus Marsarchaeota G1 archaeon OSP_D]PSN88578.1 MAG: hypothetical protein B9Q00_05020 [Candidatus Marsarchaeota G1 archaeon OSP_C]
MTLMTLLPSSIGGLMGLWEGHLVSPSLKGLELGDESSLFMWGSSDAPYCPPNERCIPESMVGTMSPLEGNPRPSRTGRRQHFNHPDLKYKHFTVRWYNTSFALGEMS